MIIGPRDIIESKLVEMLAGHIADIILERGRVTVGVVGGRSVSAIFQALKRSDIDWENVHIGLLDERVVDRDDSESNFKLLEDVMADVVGINLYPVVVDLARDGLEEQYTETINKLGGRFDIVLLSSGEDGHVAGLFPGHPVLNHKESRFVRFFDSPKPPADRITATAKLIAAADVAFLMFLGQSKKEALNLFLSDVAVKKCPAKLVESIPVSYVFTDIESEVG